MGLRQIEETKVLNIGYIHETEENSEESRLILEFSEDEETLIIRMYNLVGERLFSSHSKRPCLIYYPAFVLKVKR